MVISWDLLSGGLGSRRSTRFVGGIEDPQGGFNGIMWDPPHATMPQGMICSPW